MLRLAKPVSTPDLNCDEATGHRLNVYWKTAVGFVLITAGYLLALEYVPVDFRIVTAIYMYSVAVLCTGLETNHLKKIVARTYVLEMVILVPLIVFFVFQTFFSIQLP